jgi:hypothetical protein
MGRRIIRMGNRFSSAANFLTFLPNLDSFEYFRYIIASVAFQSSWEHGQKFHPTVGINLGHCSTWRPL